MASNKKENSSKRFKHGSYGLEVSPDGSTSIIVDQIDLIPPSRIFNVDKILLEEAGPNIELFLGQMKRKKLTAAVSLQMSRNAFKNIIQSFHEKFRTILLNDCEENEIQQGELESLFKLNELELEELPHDRHTKYKFTLVSISVNVGASMEFYSIDPGIIRRITQGHKKQPGPTPIIQAMSSVALVAYLVQRFDEISEDLGISRLTEGGN